MKQTGFYGFGFVWKGEKFRTLAMIYIFSMSKYSISVADDGVAEQRKNPRAVSSHMNDLLNLISYTIINVEIRRETGSQLFPWYK